MRTLQTIYFVTRSRLRKNNLSWPATDRRFSLKKHCILRANPGTELVDCGDNIWLPRTFETGVDWKVPIDLGMCDGSSLGPVTQRKYMWGPFSQETMKQGLWVPKAVMGTGRISDYIKLKDTRTGALWELPSEEEALLSDATFMHSVCIRKALVTQKEDRFILATVLQTNEYARKE